ncbi:MAG: metal ABC transporter substrate-binding protein [Chloroflexi bacterium]|nr:metal ABC transporter substrate-binding protein [Chloroflexota bacterium]
MPTTRNFRYFQILLTGLLLIPLLACNSTQTNQPTDRQKLKVVATTTIVGDVVAQVGDDLIELTVLLPVGTDPHSFDPTPQDIAAVADADVVFANGAGLETFLDPLIENAGARDKIVPVSEGIELLKFSGDHEDEFEGEENEHGHKGADPHTWTDPNNVMIWVQNIERAFSELDSANAGVYAVNAEKYTNELQTLDAWIREQVAKIPPANREIVTDHLIFGYFAKAYGFEQIGAIIPGYSTLAEPSAQELAALQDIIKALGVQAVFVGNTANSSLAERIADDTGIQLVFIYTGSLSDKGGEAGTYIDYIRYNVGAVVDALSK